LFPRIKRFGFPGSGWSMPKRLKLQLETRTVRILNVRSLHSHQRLVTVSQYTGGPTPPPPDIRENLLRNEGHVKLEISGFTISDFENTHFLNKRVYKYDFFLNGVYKYTLFQPRVVRRSETTLTFHLSHRSPKSWGTGYGLPASRCITREWEQVLGPHPSNPIRTDKHSDSTKLTTHLDCVSLSSNIWYKSVE